MDTQTPSDSHASRLSLHKCTAVQQAIDVEIEDIPPESLAESVCMLRARRNAHALINAWFPPELMAAIFYEIIFSSQYMHRREGLETHGFSRQHIAISHVCRVWRTIAIGTPRLWESISLVSADVATLMLHRSKASPISIVYRSVSEDETSDTVELALARADRAFEIELVMLSVHIQNLVFKYLTKPMPFLKQLKLYRHGGSPWTATPQCFLPPRLLEGVNALSHLYLIEIGILPGSILPSTLTTLSLMYSPERFTASQMVDLLEPLENLRELRLQGTLRPDGSDTTQPPAVRRLSPRTHLVQFHLDAQAPERDEFMSRLSIMPEMQMSLSCDVDTLDDLHFGQMLKPVYGARGLLRGLSLSYLSRSWIGGYSSASLPMTDSQMCFSISVQRHHVFTWYEVLRDLCAILPLDSIETLVIATIRDFEESIARLLVAHLHGVRTLRVKDTATQDVLQVLHPQAREIGPAFPRLKTLAVHYKPHDHDALAEHLLGPVADCLIARKDSGVAAAIEELEINGAVVPSKYLEDLESLKSWKHPSSVNVTI